APLEVVVANDGEERIDEALAGAGSLPVRVVPVSARLPAAARNRAAEATSASWLAMLDDDDLWRPDHLAGLASGLARPEVEVAYRDCEVIREEIAPDGRRVARGRLTIARDWDDAVMRENDYLPPSAGGAPLGLAASRRLRRELRLLRGLGL